MTIEARRSNLRVVDGDAQPMARAGLGRLSAAELSADMAALYVFGLMRDSRLDRLADPHHLVQVGPGHRVTLNQLLGQLRNLPYFDASLEVPTPARDPQGERRRARRLARLNHQSQLTLRTMYRMGVNLPGDASPLSVFLRSDHEAPCPPGPVTRPTAQSPMSRWHDWLGRICGAGYAPPGYGSRVPRLGTLGDLMAHVARMPAGRPFYNAVLAMLAHGDPFAEGLRRVPAQRRLWSGPRLCALMSEAEARMTRLSGLRSEMVSSLTRPGLVAAGLTAHLNAPGPRPVDARDDVIEAWDVLSQHAATLLDWVVRANRPHDALIDVPHSLLLPLGQAPFVQSRTMASHVLIAGALTTVLKAVLGSGPQDPEGDGPGKVALELDRLANNIALARVVAGTHFPSENSHDLRIGEAVALQILREAMAEDNLPAQVTLRSFDGDTLEMRAHPRPITGARIEFRSNGAPAPWPFQRQSSRDHLRAVV